MIGQHLRSQLECGKIVDGVSIASWYLVDNLRFLAANSDFIRRDKGFVPVFNRQSTGFPQGELSGLNFRIQILATEFEKHKGTTLVYLLLFMSLVF